MTYLLAMTAALATAGEPAIHTEDVDRFYALYDSTAGHPTAEQLQQDYLDKGSDGLHQLAKIRDVTGARVAETLAKRPEIMPAPRNAQRYCPASPSA